MDVSEQTTIRNKLSSAEQTTWLKRWLECLNQYYESVAEIEHVENREKSYQQIRPHAEQIDQHLIQQKSSGFEADWAGLLTHLSKTYSALGDAATQKKLLLRALEMDERNYGPDHVMVAITLGNLAGAEGDLGNTERKEELLQRALNIFEQRYGSDHITVATTLVNLATVQAARGNAGKQKSLLQRALPILEKANRAEH